MRLGTAKSEKTILEEIQAGRYFYVADLNTRVNKANTIKGFEIKYTNRIPDGKGIEVECSSCENFKTILLEHIKGIDIDYGEIMKFDILYGQDFYRLLLAIEKYVYMYEIDNEN
ncbi:MAG: hypothetical protein KAT62_00130 [Desulfuromonadales bacterium]|nr:hypothetical protein [Desulfuromonadales bacterium]